MTRLAVALTVCILAAAVVLQAQTTGPTKSHAGLEMTIAGVERQPNVSLQDCPPGENTVRGMTKPNEEFAVVTVRFKVLPGFAPTPLKRPELQDAKGNTYYTAVSFVDVGSTPEFSCAFPFRVPKGTSLKTLHIDQASFDLTIPEKQN